MFVHPVHLITITMDAFDNHHADMLILQLEANMT
jgi:hypothetical protein